MFSSLKKKSTNKLVYLLLFGLMIVVTNNVSAQNKPCSSGDNPAANEVFVYSDPGYKGNCVRLSLTNKDLSNSYPNPAAIGIANDTISSIKVGSGARAMLCVDDDYKGFCFTQGFSLEKLTAGTNPNVPQLDNNMSSILVMPSPRSNVVKMNITNNSDVELAAFEKVTGIDINTISYLGRLQPKAGAAIYTYKGVPVTVARYDANRQMFISNGGFQPQVPGDKNVTIENAAKGAIKIVE